MHSEIIGAILENYQYELIICAVLLLVERIRPIEKRQPFFGIAFNLLVAVALAASTQVVIRLVAHYMPPLPFQPILTVAPPNNWQGRIACDLLVLLIYDFFAYWLHRIEHALPLLWNVHKLHHQEEHMNVSTSNRHNPLEAVLRVPFIMLPMVTLFDLPFVTLVFGVSLGVLIPSFSHMNLKLEMGWLTAVITGPQLHRLHHSSQERHFNKNFANIFPLWDIIFGTYLAPEKGQFPKTGLATRHRRQNEISFSDLNESPGSVDKLPNLVADYIS